MPSIADFSVVLTGANDHIRCTAAVLIDKALRERGFNNIDVVDNHGEHMDLPKDMPTMLDAMRRNAPTFFNAFVTIQEVKVRSYDQSYFEETLSPPGSNLN